MPTNPHFEVGSRTIHLLTVVNFLRHVIVRDNLSIADYLKDMGQEPFLLVAATGLGKSVAVPVHVFIRLTQSLGERPNPVPRVWVVEPRIPIAVDLANHMNSLWQEYAKHKRVQRVPPLFGCVSSASGNSNPEAPIKFVTTGIFESLAKKGELTPERDRVIIDEAHVTVEQNPGVELGIALARQALVPIDYMSATVDTTTLGEDLGLTTIIRADQQRYPIWKHNLLRPLHEVLSELVESTLVHPDRHSPYFPKTDTYAPAKEVLRAVLEPGRSHGLLAVVNSFAGEQSDVRRLADALRRSHPDMPVLFMASEVVRDPRREREFKERLRQIEQDKHNYVILATSVVEMGITFPSLDFVVTMDSGYDQETIGDVTFPVVAPLGVNSLLQRMGRVGRLRPGIAYISYEEGADYAELDDAALNSGNRLAYERIHFPMASAPLMSLAYYACAQEWEDLGTAVANLHLPSRIHESAERMAFLDEQVQTLKRLSIAEGHRLTDLGKKMGPWIGQADLAYATELMRRFDWNVKLPELLFWVVATALSNTPIVTLRARHDFFVDYEGVHSSIPHYIDIWNGAFNEDISLFGAIANIAELVPLSLFGRRSSAAEHWDFAEVDRWSGLAGLDARKLLKVAAAITDVWELFGKLNSKEKWFNELFGDATVPELTTLPWSRLFQGISIQTLWWVLVELPGSTHVRITRNQRGGFEWKDLRHGHIGLINQDDTPIQLVDGHIYAARLIPGRVEKGAETIWRLSHLSTLPEETPGEAFEREFDEAISGLLDCNIEQQQ